MALLACGLRPLRESCGKSVGNIANRSFITKGCLFNPLRTPKPHLYFVRTVRRARFAHLVGVDPALSEHVRMLAVVIYRGPQSVIAVDVHRVRVGPRPVEKHQLGPIRNARSGPEPNVTRRGCALEVEGVLLGVIKPDAIERRLVFMSRERTVEIRRFPVEFGSSRKGERTVMETEPIGRACR